MAQDGAAPVHEIGRRRTFAIVSHPDAGKTTLTEKLLLYGGALHLAGSVTARKMQRATTSDWMELERKRGISVSSTVLQFEYARHWINLLDTPGHNDFSEDTYRVLTAVDAAIMVIDAGKGIEGQTRKLFEVCRRRHIPIFTFINKMDRPGREPLALIDEIEKVLGIGAYPMNWPLGSGGGFQGVWERQTGLAHLYERTPGGAYRAPVETCGLADPSLREKLEPHAHERACEEIEMLNGAGVSFARADVLAGRITPVYFGSALNNFGVQLLLDGFLSHSSGPVGRPSGQRIIEPTHPAFSGFVFKIQANMNPHHRDRVAFVRVVSGVFRRDMTVTHPGTGKPIRLANASRLFGRERETVDVAYPGDVVGIVGNAGFAIGDTLTEDDSIRFDEIPRFAPECFVYLESPVPAHYRRFRTGLDQLLQEGVVQLFTIPSDGRGVPLLGAVGPLQIDVVQFRLESEYGAASRLEATPWSRSRWLDPATPPDQLNIASGACLAADAAGRPVVLFKDDWYLQFFARQNKNVGLSEVPYR
jgi:peptide chain release factor 3